MSLKGSEKRKYSLKYKDPQEKHILSHNIFFYIIVFLIIVYQRIFSPIFGQNCRFIPTCSSYSISALKKYGLIKGLSISIKRICKCHPWNKGGYDPVP